MKTAFLNTLGFLFLTLILAVAWFTAQTAPAPVYVVQAGDKMADVAAEVGVSVEELAAANGAEADTFAPSTGAVIVVPAVAPSALDTALVHAAGLAATAFGVLLSFWLGLVAGLVPRGYRRQILAISAILGVVSYAATAAVMPVVPRLTPQFVFAAVRDGFAWAAGFPLFARVFGFRGDAVLAQEGKPLAPAEVDPVPAGETPQE